MNYFHSTKYKTFRETEIASDSEQEALDDLYYKTDDEYFDIDLFNQKQFLEVVQNGLIIGNMIEKIGLIQYFDRKEWIDYRKHAHLIGKMHYESEEFDEDEYEDDSDLNEDMNDDMQHESNDADIEDASDNESETEIQNNDIISNIQPIVNDESNDADIEDASDIQPNVNDVPLSAPAVRRSVRIANRIENDSRYDAVRARYARVTAAQENESVYIAQ